MVRLMLKGEVTESQHIAIKLKQILQTMTAVCTWNISYAVALE